MSGTGRPESETALHRWTRAAFAEEHPAREHLPRHIAMDEAIDLVREARRCWGQTKVVSRDGERRIAGLGSVLGPPSILDEILELVEAVQEVEVRLSAAPPVPRAPLPEALRALRELRALFRWVAFDGGDSRLQRQLERLRRAHGRPRTMDALAVALVDYATLAEREEARLALPAFDPAVIGSARDVAARLLAHPPKGARNPDRRPGEELRRRLLSLIASRVKKVRTAGQFVFREHPALVRTLTSRYERTRRSRKRSQGNLTGNPPST